jgi:hypothetical protein
VRHNCYKVILYLHAMLWQTIFTSASVAAVGIARVQSRLI